MAIQVDFIGTEVFYNNWSGNPVDKARKIRDYCERRWQDILKGNPNYQINLEYRDRSEVEISNAALKTEKIGMRKLRQINWLKNEWSKCSKSDAIVVLDYFQDNPTCGDPTPGLSSGAAGTANQFNATVNTRIEDRNPANLDPAQGSEQIAQHELCHLFSVKHPEHVSLDSNSEVSLMYSEQEEPAPFGCRTPSNYNGNHTNLTIGDWHSTCTEKSVCSYLRATFP